MLAHYASAPCSASKLEVVSQPTSRVVNERWKLHGRPIIAEASQPRGGDGALKTPRLVSKACVELTAGLRTHSSPPCTDAHFTHVAL